jgi:hypothetical protein
MIAYATAPGKTASDVGQGIGPYAKALSEEIIKPGVESVMMFRNVQLKVKEAIGQDPWLSFPTLPAVYFAGTKPAALTPEQERELAFWLSVKDSISPAVLATYTERYPEGEFAAIARALAEHYDRKLKAEQAAQEEERKRIEEERKATQVKRLEEERRAREAAIADERKRAVEEKAGEDARSLDEQQQAELFARTEALRKALEEVRRAREAANAAEQQRLAAVKASEEATKAADAAIALKRDTERHADPTKIAALPNIEMGNELSQYDGVWLVHRVSTSCPTKDWHFLFRVSGGVVAGSAPVNGRIVGSVSASGHLSLSHAGAHDGQTDGTRVSYSGSFKGNSASGSFSHTRGCTGTFSARRK